MIVIGMTTTHVDFIADYREGKFCDAFRVVDQLTENGVEPSITLFRPTAFSSMPDGTRRKYNLSEESVKIFDELEKADIIDKYKIILKNLYENFSAFEKFNMVEE